MSVHCLYKASTKCPVNAGSELLVNLEIQAIIMIALKRLPPLPSHQSDEIRLSNEEINTLKVTQVWNEHVYMSLQNCRHLCQTIYLFIYFDGLLWAPIATHKEHEGLL